MIEMGVRHQDVLDRFTTERAQQRVEPPLLARHLEPGSARSAWALIHDAPEPDRIELDADGTVALVFRRVTRRVVRLTNNCFRRPEFVSGRRQSNLT